MAIQTVTFSRIDGEPKQEAGSLSSRVLTLLFRVTAGETTVPLLPTTAGNAADGSVSGTPAKPNILHAAGLASAMRAEVVEPVHLVSTPTTIIRSYVDVSTLPGNLYLATAPTNSVDYTCKVRVYGF